MLVLKAGQRTKKERPDTRERATPERSSPDPSQLSSLTFNRSGFLSFLSSPGRDGDGDGGHGTTVAFWPFFFLPPPTHLYTRSHSQVCVWTYSKCGVWCVETSTYLSLSYRKLTQIQTQKELLRRIKSFPCIAYLFIYLTLQTFIRSRKGLHRVCLLVPNNDLLDIHTFTYIQTCTGTARWRHGFNCSPEELQVECLTQGHLDTSEC